MTDAPLVQQSPGEKLVSYARGLAASIADSPEAQAARALADSITGLVVTDDASNVAANDLGAAATSHTKKLKAAFAELKEHPKAMLAVIKEVEDSLLVPLAAVRASVDAAQLAYERLQRLAAQRAEQERQRILREQEAEVRRLEAEREAVRLEAERQRQEEVAAAALEGREPEAAPVEEPVEDIPPPAVPEVVAPPPALVRTSAGHSTTVNRLTCELVDVSAADPFWLVLANTKAPIASFEVAVSRGDAPNPGIEKENAVTWRGVKFWREPSKSRGAR